jgi:hypothetical protein
MHRRAYLIVTMSLCGLGYTYPSSIQLTDEPQLVTCQACRTKMRHLKSLNTQVNLLMWLAVASTVLVAAFTTVRIAI